PPARRSSAARTTVQALPLPRVFRCPTLRTPTPTAHYPSPTPERVSEPCPRRPGRRWAAGDRPVHPPPPRAAPTTPTRPPPRGGRGGDRAGDDAKPDCRDQGPARPPRG